MNDISIKLLKYKLISAYAHNKTAAINRSKTWNLTVYFM